MDDGCLLNSIDQHYITMALNILLTISSKIINVVLTMRIVFEQLIHNFYKCLKYNYFWQYMASKINTFNMILINITSIYAAI